MPASTCGSRARKRPRARCVRRARTPAWSRRPRRCPRPARAAPRRSISGWSNVMRSPSSAPALWRAALRSPPAWRGWSRPPWAGARLRNVSSAELARCELAMFFSSCSRSFSRRLRCASTCTCGTLSTRSNSGVERMAGADFGAASGLERRASRWPASRWPRRARAPRPALARASTARLRAASFGSSFISARSVRASGDDLLQQADLALGGGVRQLRRVAADRRPARSTRAGSRVRGQPLPQLLGEERHHRVQQPQRRLERRQQCCASRR